MKTTTKELSEKLTAALDAAGYEYEVDFLHHHLVLDPVYYVVLLASNKNIELKKLTPAFTMCELWDMLPDYVHCGSYQLQTRKNNDLFYASYDTHDDYEDVLCYKNSANPCDALAELVLWCIENNHPLNLKKKNQ